MPRRLIVTLVCFHASAAVVLMVGLGLTFMQLLFADHMGWPLDGVVVILSAVAIEVVALSLKQVKYWAWIAGIMISGFMIVYGFITLYVSLIIGGLSLWGLVDPESVAAFKPKNGSVGSSTETD